MEEVLICELDEVCEEVRLGETDAFWGAGGP